MVRRSPDGSLSWFQKGAGKITVTPAQSEAYSAAAATEDLQLNADITNSSAEDLYLDALANAQENVDASRPIDAIPVKPLFISVADPVIDRSGNVTAGKSVKTTWPDPLPELVRKKVWKSGATSPTLEDIIVKS
jgi:hypothetical protein